MKQSCYIVQQFPYVSYLTQFVQEEQHGATLLCLENHEDLSYHHFAKEILYQPDNPLAIPTKSYTTQRMKHFMF
jgi:hypothetical protein